MYVAGLTYWTSLYSYISPISVKQIVAVNSALLEQLEKEMSQWPYSNVADVLMKTVGYIISDTVSTQSTHTSNCRLPS